MKREADLARRLHSLRALGEAIGAMKSLSAHHFRATRAAVEPARAYRDGVERIVGWSGASLAAGNGAAGLVVIGSELGLCGGYNARLVAAAAARRRELGDGPTLCVGRRAAALLGRRGVAVTSSFGGPSSVDGITAVLLELAEEMLTLYATDDLASFDIVSSRFAGVGTASPEAVRLLPITARGAGGRRRARYVDSEQLISSVIREHLYITLFELLLDALASEHGARLAATQSAESWLDERIERLQRQLMANRRETSTQEVIEIASGARNRGRRP
jgi:F-type H+-transporting ATPase subunit gamma